MLNAVTEFSIVYYDHQDLWKQIMYNAYTDSILVVSANSKAKRYVEQTFGVALTEVQRHNEQRENLHTMLGTARFKFIF